MSTYRQLTVNLINLTNDEETVQLFTLVLLFSDMLMNSDDAASHKNSGAYTTVRTRWTLRRHRAKKTTITICSVGDVPRTAAYSCEESPARAPFGEKALPPSSPSLFCTLPSPSPGASSALRSQSRHLLLLLAKYS